MESLGYAGIIRGNLLHVIAGPDRRTCRRHRSRLQKPANPALGPETLVRKPKRELASATVGAGDIGIRMAGYRTNELVWKNQGEAVYAGTRLADGLAVTAKIYDRELCEQAPARFEYEYSALGDLASTVLTAALGRVDLDDHRVLIFARPAGAPLLERVHGPVELPRLVDLACQAASALAALHGRRLTHRHLRPRALMLNAASGRIVLTDLGFSLGQDRAARDLQGPSVLHGSLPYLSPEQTGRIARPFDRRSDLYSLGTIIYQLATGRPPFSGRDAMELIHAHLAQKPLPVREERRDMPRILSDIIDRLLAKDPAERYQSADGLLVDLEKCRDGIAQGWLTNFELGTGDRGGTFDFPERLYGRDAEIAELQAAVESACGGVSCHVLISGPPGIGKTALVEAARATVLARGGHFAVGKFDLTRKGAPFMALAQAVASRVDALVVLPDHELASWRRRLLDTLGGLGPLLYEFAPNLQGLLGDGTALPPVGSLEAKHRLELAFRRFFRAVASPQCPLLLFIDDLQWSDPGSLEVWEQLALDAIAGLVLVGAYRMPELDAQCSLERMIERLDVQCVKLRRIQLTAITPQAVGSLIMDALHVERDRAEALVQLLAKRAEHNPLVIRRLLLYMAERRVLIRESRGWRWNAEHLVDIGLPESLIDVIHTKIDGLAPEPRAALLAASCLGSPFDTESLAAALDQDPLTVFGLLAALREQGLVVEAGGKYHFEHDGVLEAAGLRLEEADGYVHHLRAGRFRRARADGESLQAQVFTILGHLNRTIERDDDAERLLDLARLNLIAGTKALRSAAYGRAIDYLRSGLSALARRGALNGADDAILSSSLELELARATAFSGDLPSSNRLFDELSSRALPELRLALICSARVEVSLAAGEFEDAVRWGLRGLAHTGLTLPRHPSKASLMRELLRTGWMTRGDIGRRIRELPDCDDPHIQIRIELLSVLVVAVIRLGGELVPLLFLAGARETFVHGRTPASPHALTAFGSLLVGVFGRLTAAAKLADEALVLARAPNTRHRSKVILASHAMLLPWTRPFEICVEELSTVYEMASLEGDFLFAGYGLVFVANCHMAMGVPVEQLHHSAERARSYLAGTATASVTAGQEVLVGIADWLSGASDLSLDTDDPFGALTNPDLSVRCPSLVFSSALHCVAGQPERALRLLESIESVAEVTLLAVAERAEYYFWRALAAAMASDPEGWKHSPNRHRLRQGLRHFRRWAKLCRENFGGKALLLEAEWARLSASPSKAAPLYLAAGEMATRHGRLHVAAVAYERLARTGASSGSSLGRSVKLATLAYAAWGAKRKVDALTAEFRHALPNQETVLALPAPASPRQRASAFNPVDLASVLKTTRAITAAPDYQSVVERLMAGLIENAGAQRGVLVMQGSAGWTVEMAYGVNGPEPEASGVPLHAAQALVPVGMLNLVESNRSPFIYDDGRDGSSLAHDAYIAGRGVRAAMCVPIELQGRCIGAIYLENNLSPGVFTPERIEIVVALAAQAAISLTNARLFGALRASDAEWRSLVDHAPDLIMVVNREHAIEFMNHAPLGMDAGLRGARVESFLSATGRSSLAEAIDSVFERGGHVSCDTQYAVNGQRRRLLVTRISPIAIDGKVARVTLLSTDVTDRRAIEDHLSQTQKLEAIGTLAGGVAHDFNNLLSVIMGTCEVGLRSCSDDCPHQQRYTAILATTARATSLTRQLLTFSRKGSSDIEALSLDEVIEDSCKMLERLLGEDVQIERALSPGMGRVLMNRCQLEQVLLNLSINARDAMPGGGRLSFRTREEVIERGSSNSSLPPGRYAVLEVTDTGCGMDDATRRRVFEPFFTTKSVGRGTGLGLATVHGIVYRAGGQVNVTSTLGVGTAFEILLPIASGAPVLENSSATLPAELPRGSETILLVEDNHEVRALTAAMLEGQGYRVISAANGTRALLDTAAIAAADLLFTDVLMPGLKGTELAREVLRRKPQIKLLYSSGRGLDLTLEHDLPGQGEAPFLPKPYSLAQLAHTVRSLLDERRPGPIP
jgi:predicted ATPase/signal transduction histidine kinase/CheY-like chemotaxis protein